MSDYLSLAFAVALPNIGGIAGAVISRRNKDEWYEGLKFPSYRPPNKVFGLVWTTLYCTMGYSSYLVWRDGGGFDGDAALPLALYGTQLAINWSFSPLFFGLRSPKLGFLNCVCLWGALAGTIYSFHSINQRAAFMMLPYLAWVSFASVLSFRVWRDNRDKSD